MLVLIRKIDLKRACYSCTSLLNWRNELIALLDWYTHVGAHNREVGLLNQAPWSGKDTD